MSWELAIPIINSLGWLVLCAAALASYRLHWGQMLKVALVWLAIFVGLYVVAEWFVVAQVTARSVA
ncbi:MAG: hypothetical protein ACK4IC_01530 [Erythrobacter sp.]